MPDPSLGSLRPPGRSRKGSRPHTRPAARPAGSRPKAGGAHNRHALAGQRFGRLTAVSDTGRRLGGHVVWRCRCVCGGTTEATARNLRSGNTRSCGCLQVEVSSRPNARRGEHA